MGVSAAQGSAGLKPGVCTSTTRPSNPFEGQMIYETDTDLVRVWNGTAWRNIAATNVTTGSVLQFVQGADATGLLSSTSATYVTSGVTVSITPTSNTSKILLVYSLQTFTSLAGTGVGLQLKRGATAIVADVDNSYGQNSGVGVTSTLWGLDSPSTTSATTYSVFYNRNQGTGTAYINASGAGVSRMFAMEISA